MNKLSKRQTYCVLASPLLFMIYSCNADTTNAGNSELQMQLSLPGREILAVEDSELGVNVSVNGLPQVAGQPGQGGSLEVTVSGIVRDESNTVEITWFENYNGQEIELSRQTQQFLAAGNSFTIDAPHVSDVFDYDGDGDSNLTERNNSTCVWSAVESCLISGNLDVPDSVIQSDVGNGSAEAAYPNIVLSSDFEDDRNGWYVQGLPFSTDGEFCATTEASNSILILFFIGQDEFLSLNRSRYAVEFDIRANGPGTLFFTIHEPAANMLWHEEEIAVGVDNRRVRIDYRHQGDSIRDGVLVGFNSLLQTGPVTYCMDNVVISSELPQ